MSARRLRWETKIKAAVRMYLEKKGFEVKRVEMVVVTHRLTNTMTLLSEVEV